MYHSAKTIIKPYMKMVDLIESNPLLLLMMQHFNIDFNVSDLTVSQLCEHYEISENLFINIANLYNGFKIKESPELSKNEVLNVIDFLKNSHNYYRSDKYPQLRSYINQLKENHPEKEIALLERFFDEYFQEVMEHLDYEDNIAFPYFIDLITRNQYVISDAYSAKEYSKHHTDIELKLADLKKLLLKHIKIEDDLNLKRKLLLSLFELEFDLYIHSLIEDSILIPAGYVIEKDV